MPTLDLSVETGKATHRGWAGAPNLARDGFGGTPRQIFWCQVRANGAEEAGTTEGDGGRVIRVLSATGTRYLLMEMVPTVWSPS